MRDYHAETENEKGIMRWIERSEKALRAYGVRQAERPIQMSGTQTALYRHCIFYLDKINELFRSNVSGTARFLFG